MSLDSTPNVPVSTSKCPHCKGETQTGIGGGCGTCRKVKASADGRKPPRRAKKDAEA